MRADAAAYLPDCDFGSATDNELAHAVCPLIGLDALVVSGSLLPVRCRAF
jgi:hypothetical protein